MADTKTNNHIRIASYNCRGAFGASLLFINYLVSQCDVLLIQEHWGLTDQMRDLESRLDNARVYGKSGMDESQPLVGRPHGGCAVIVRKDLKCSVEPVTTMNKRLFSCLIRLPGNDEFLIHNVYMPTDTQHDMCNLDEFCDVLSEINVSCSCHISAQCIVGGDFNTELMRINSLHTNALMSFCSDLSLTLCSTLPCANTDYSYANSDLSSVSLIDHFAVDEVLSEKVLEYYCLHRGDNLSDHSPLFLVLQLDSAADCVPPSSASTGSSRVSWSKASEEDIADYKHVLSYLLEQVIPPSLRGCIGSGFSCDSENHRGLIEHYFETISSACLAAAEVCIPKQGGRKRVAGWNDHVETFKGASIMWHRIWDANGKPGNGVVYDLMLKAKREYKSAVRWVLRHQDELSSMRMADGILNNKSRDLWAEVKKKTHSRCSTPGIVDGVEGDHEIGELFCAKFDELYNCVSYNADEMLELKHSVFDLVSSRCRSGLCYCDHSVDVRSVIDAVRRLKCGKSGGSGKPSSDHIVHAPRGLAVHLSLLFTMMLSHAFVPSEFLLSALVPIPKNPRKSLNGSDNYRSIAIGSIFGKVFDNVVIEKHASTLNSSFLQFGFKARHSTIQCCFSINEVINYYVERGSRCHAILLDASRAFDRVSYLKLFKLLIERRMCPSTISVLLSMYTNQSMFVSWNGSSSRFFRCSNGVKQGGVLSPLLFCVYVDELLGRLQSIGVGCHVGDQFVGAFGYADDLTLLAPSIFAAESMLLVCEVFSEEYNVLFNASKSAHLVFHNAPSDPLAAGSLKLNGIMIPIVEDASLLGTCFGPRQVGNNFSKAIGDMYYRTNLLLARFHTCSSSTLSFLFRSYCTSFYGSPLWPLDDASLGRLSIAWRRSLKRVWRVSPLTHSVLIPLINNCAPLKIQFLLRFCTFIKSCMISTNPILTLLTSIAQKSFSISGCNIRSLCHSLNIPTLHDLLEINCKDFLLSSNDANIEASCSAQAIVELCNARDNRDYSFFTSHELELLIKHLCIA
jgi:hypothetical protein